MLNYCFAFSSFWNKVRVKIKSTKQISEPIPCLRGALGFEVQNPRPRGCSNFPGPNLFLAPNDAAGNRIVASLWGSHAGHGHGAVDRCLATAPPACRAARAPGWDPVTPAGFTCMEWYRALGQQAGLTMVPGAILARGKDVCKRNGLLILSVLSVTVGCLLGFFLRTRRLSPQVSHPRASQGPCRGGVCGPEGSGNHSPTLWLPSDMRVEESLCLSESQSSYL